MKVNQKGQVVIPKKIREKYGIQPGQDVEFREEEGELVLVKKGVREQVDQALDSFDFRLPEGIKSIDEFLDEVRGT